MDNLAEVRVCAFRVPPELVWGLIVERFVPTRPPAGGCEDLVFEFTCAFRKERIFSGTDAF